MKNTETIWLSISAGSGPEECAHAAANTIQAMLEELQQRTDLDISISIIENEAARKKGNIRSALLSLKGKDAKVFSDSWTGIIQWIFWSPYRSFHKRKNWFVQVRPYIEPLEGELFSPKDVRFETAKAGGPGGQHVNKTETAVRAVHIPTGKSALARGERSQLLNKELALAKLASIIHEEGTKRKKESRSNLRHSHWELERGNPVRVYAFDGKSIKQVEKLKAEKLNG